MPAIVPLKKDSEQEKREGPVWDFFRNTVTDIREIAPALITGPLMLGRDLGMDIGSMARGDFDFDRTGRDVAGMVEGFKETSPLVPLVQGDFGEAGSRFHERPVTGSLDFLGAAGLGASALSKGARGLAMTAPPAARRSLMETAGYERLGRVGDVDIARPQPSLRYRYAPGTIIGDDVFARPTHRRILPSHDSPILQRGPGLTDDVPATPEGRRLRDEQAADRLMGIDAWRRISPNPLWRSLNEAQAAARRFIPSERMFSSDKQMMRSQRRAVERGMHVAYATARDFHAEPNKQLMNEVAAELQKRGIRDVNIEDAVDLAAYYSAAGYSNIGQRLRDLENTHLGDAQQARVTRKTEEYNFYQNEANKIRNQIEQLKRNGVDMEDPRVTEMRRQWHANHRRSVQARAAAARSMEYLEKRSKAKLNDISPSDPLSGFKYERQQLDELGDLVDEIMRSPSMERWLDKIERAADNAEIYAMRNYGLGLSKKDAIDNRYRMAELYQPAGVTDETKRMYSRRRLDGTGYRSPIFIPMRSKKADAQPFSVGKEVDPFKSQYQINVEDPMNLELWNQNVRAPITRGLFMRKHMKEITDFEQNRILDNARRLAFPISRKQAEQWKQLERHSKEQDLTTIKPNGKVENPEAGFVELGEYGQVIDDYRARASELSTALRNSGQEKAANLMDMAVTDMAVTADSQIGKTKITGQQSVQDIERMRNLTDGMTTILPSPVYASIAENMTKTAGLINEIANAPSLRASAAKGFKEATKYWRYSVLHTRPKWMFNNALGTIYMLAMQEGWLPALSNIVRNSTIFNWARRFLGVEPKKYERGGSRYINELVEERMSDVLYASGSSSMFGEKSGRMFGFTNRNLTKLQRLDRAFDVIADFNAKFADNPARSARVMTLLDEMVDVKMQERAALGKKQKTRDEMRIEVLDDLDAREQLAARVLEDMIDFQDLSAMERRIVAYGMPFYSWIKGSTKATARHLADHPARIGWQRYAGMEAQEQIREDFPGGVPAYLLSSIPGGWTGDKPRSIVNFAGASPAQTLGDLSAMSLSYAGGVPQQFGTESILGFTHPAYNAAIGMTSYRHPFYGTPIARDTLPPMIAWETLQPPAYRSLYRAGVVPRTPLGGGMYEPSGTTIAEHDPWSYLKRLATPVEQSVVPGVAADRYREERSELGY